MNKELLVVMQGIFERPEYSKKLFHCGQTTQNGVVYGGTKNADSVAKDIGFTTANLALMENISDLEKFGVYIKDGIVTMGKNEEENKQFKITVRSLFAMAHNGDIHVLRGTDLRPCGTPEEKYSKSTYAGMQMLIFALKKDQHQYVYHRCVVTGEIK